MFYKLIFEMENSLQCYLCSRVYKLQCVLNRHLREVHKVKVLPGGKLKCPLCKTFSVNRHTSLRAHLEETHSINCERRNIMFASFEVFNKWKTNEEKQSLFCYTKKTSGKVVAGQAERFYLHCHRSGHYQSKSTGERRLKRQGSNRIDSTCPSMMVVTREASGQIKVMYWLTHVGHEADAEHTVGPKEEATRVGCERQQSDEAEIEVKEEPFLFTEDMLPLLYRPGSGLDQDNLGVIVQVMRCDDNELPDDNRAVSLRKVRDLADVKLTVVKVTEHGEETIEVSAAGSGSTGTRVLEGGPHLETTRGRIRRTAEILRVLARRAGDIDEEVAGEVLRLMNEAISLLGADDVLADSMSVVNC